VTHEDANVSRVMRYSSTDTLVNNLQIILSMPELCDVVFLVGEKQVPVYGVKAVLSTRSKVFNKLILKAQQEQQMMSQKSKKKSPKKHVVIKVRKYQVEDFRKIINFIHCGKVEVSKRSVAGLFIGATQFALSDLRTACTDYLSRKMKSGSAPDLVNSATFYKEHSSYDRFVSTVNTVMSEKLSASFKETQL
ncbi:hypothetical protein FSP39_020276, partial [Pinctada imbricata]